jgi:hypothetical protein
MNFRIIVLSMVMLAFGTGQALADITSSQLGGPFALAPGAGLEVTGSITGPFYASLSSPPFSPSYSIVDVLGNIHAADGSNDPLTGFAITGVTVTEDSLTSTPSLDKFSLLSTTTYTDSVYSYTATVNPADLNLAFIVPLSSSLPYSYTLDVTGLSSGDYVLYDDVEGVLVTPEPSALSILPVLLMTLVLIERPRCFRFRARQLKTRF